MKVQHLQSSCLDRAVLRVEELRFLENGPYSFSLLPSQIIGFSGQSGVGKSQLFRAIVDVLPFRGRVTYGGRECSKTPATAWRTIIGLVPSEPVWWHDQVGEHFTDKSVAGFGLEMLFERLGFSVDVFNWRVSRLSSGEKQRLAIVRALINNPGVLLLDEPTANLNQQVTLEVEKLLIEFQQKTQTAYAIVSHDEEQLVRFCETIYSVKKDRLEAVKDGGES